MIVLESFLDWTKENLCLNIDLAIMHLIMAILQKELVSILFRAMTSIQEPKIVIHSRNMMQLESLYLFQKVMLAKKEKDS